MSLLNIAAGHHDPLDNHGNGIFSVGATCQRENNGALAKACNVRWRQHR